MPRLTFVGLVAIIFGTGKLLEMLRHFGDGPRTRNSSRRRRDSGQKYCRECAPDVVKENILKAAAIGRLNTHKPKAQARRSETQRRQNAALKAWNPKDHPGWLDRTCYEQRIRPLLRLISVPQIMSAIKVSEPYALSIRAGKRTPHPRNWLKPSSARWKHAKYERVTGSWARQKDACL